MTCKEKLDGLPYPLREDIKSKLNKWLVCASIREGLRFKGLIGLDTPIIAANYRLFHPDDNFTEEIPFTMTLSDCIDYLEETE